MQYNKFRESIHSDKHKAIRELLINKRKELGLSQQALADKLNVIRTNNKSVILIKNQILL